MIYWLQSWLLLDDTKLLYILTLILIANVLDFLLGWLNARFSKQIEFSSSQAIYGISRKIVIFILLVYFIPVAMLVPEPVGIGALLILYTGYLLSELNSILSHLGLANDDKKSNIFADFIKTIFQVKENEE